MLREPRYGYDLRQSLVERGLPIEESTPTWSASCPARSAPTWRSSCGPCWPTRRRSLAVCAVLTWGIGSGPIFTAAPTDEAMKSWSALIILASLVELAVRARRLSVAHALNRR
ncbi:hypothetical protein [Dactylosporangium sp. CA-139066]|uniref:hypothetical protein n=1 Tax=Dactylosporangium sp. CA-139066 TaxID=3239930 RepID=UPI003D92E6D9